MFKVVFSFAILLSFVGAECYGQHHHIGIHITPSQSYRKLNRELSRWDDLHERVITMSYGLDYRVKLGGKISLYSGLALSTIGYDEQTYIKDIQYEHRYYYIDLPVGIEYRLLSGNKFSCWIGSDIGLNKLYKVTRETQAPNGDGVLPADLTTKGSELKDSNFQIYNQSIRFMVGVGYKISSTMEIRLSPEYRYLLNSTNKNEDRTAGLYYKGIHLYSYGVAVSASYAF